MKPALMILIVIIVSINLKGQTCSCVFKYYDSSTFKPVKLFSLNNNNILGLYGEQNIERKDTSYNSVAICFCNKNRIVYDMTDFGMISFKIKQNQDSLFVEEIVGIPNGENYKFIWQPFYITKLFFVKDSLIEKDSYKKGLRKYSQSQIKEILKQYKKLKKTNCDHILELANRLFWAYISGSKEAEINLKAFPEKFGPFDGACAEEWDDLLGSYMQWKKLEKQGLFN